MYAPITAESANTHTTQLDNAPIVSRVQTDEQKTNCLRELLDKVRTRNINTVEGLQQLFERQKATRRAYINVMDPKGPFAYAFAQLYLNSLTTNGASLVSNQNAAEQKADQPRPDFNQQSDDFSKVPYNSYRSTIFAAALEDIQSYVLNRRDEQVAMLTQLEDPKFFQEVIQALSTGYTSPPKQEGLSEQKKKVLVDELVQLNGLGKREPAIHIRMTALGHEHGHWALAKALDPKGPLVSVLASVLAPQASHLTSEEVNKNAHDYLAHFQKLAVLVAEAMTCNGEIVTEAVKQSEESRLKSGVVVPVYPSANDNRFTAAISPGEQAARTVFGNWVASLFQSSDMPTQQYNSR